MSQMKQEPVELDNDDDEIRSITGSEWTEDTRCTNGETIETMKTLKLKMGTLRAKLNEIKAEQKCAKMETKEAIMKAQLAANTELTKAIEQLEAHFTDKLILLQQQMEEKHQKEIAELKAKNAEVNKAVLEWLVKAELTKKMQDFETGFANKLAFQIDLRSLDEKFQIEIGEMKAKTGDENKAILEKLTKVESHMVKISNLVGGWQGVLDFSYQSSNNNGTGFQLSKEKLREDHFPGKIICYYEISMKSGSYTFQIGFTDGSRDSTTKWTRPAGVSINEAFADKPMPISPAGDILYPTVSLIHNHNRPNEVKVDCNFGGKAFQFDVANYFAGLDID